MIDNNSRFTLRDLPLPAKLVVTSFLISVGLGYCWALMQLHFKHASKGNLAPSQADVVARFSGKPWPLDGPEEKPVQAPKANPFGKFAVDGIKIKNLIADRCVVCHSADGGEEPHFNSYDDLAKFFEPKPGTGKIHKLISAPEEAGWGKDSSMRLAFTEKGYIGDDEWKKAFRKLDPDKQKELLEEREAERQTMIAWLEAGATKESYEKDFFKPEKAPEAPAESRASKARRRQMSVDALTQSTHAHLLTFSLLWAATGLVFAFTSYPAIVRSTLAPIVLIAQIIDIACWWLARLPDTGPYFALAIMGTGAIVGLGLGLQIVLSLFNMHSWKGKFLILLLLLGGGAAGGWVYTQHVAPMVAEEKQGAGQ